jgi:hypothetical protein
VRVLIEEEMGGLTYSVQYTTDDERKRSSVIIRKMHRDFVMKLWKLMEKSMFVL